LLVVLAVPVPAIASIAPVAGGPAPREAQTLPVRFAADAHYAPYDLLDADGQPTGYDVEVFRAIAAHARLDVSWRLGGDWDRTLDDLAKGRVDVVPMFFTDERAALYLFSKPVLTRYHLAFGPRGGAYVEDVEALHGLRIAVQPGGAAWERIRHLAGVRLVAAQAESEALRAVHEGRADYAVVPSYIGHLAQREGHFDDVVALSGPMIHQPYGFAVRRDFPQLRDRIDEGLARATRGGELDRIYFVWLANITPVKDVFRSGLHTGLLVAIALLLLGGIFLWWWHRTHTRVRREAATRAGAEHASFIAAHDPMTGLANRRGLEADVAALIARGAPFALVRMELEMETVEAIAGHDFVDRFRQALAERLRGEFAPASVATLGQGSFAIACEGVAEAAQALAHMRLLVDLLRSPLQVDGVSLWRACHAGGALFPRHGTTPDALLRAASIASAAAREGKRAMVLFTPDMAPDPKSLTLLDDLQQAIRERRVGYMLQPKLDLRSGLISGAELLVRWHHPVHGLLEPAEFVPLAERSGMIGDLSLHLIAEAAALCRAIRHDRPLHLAVNVSVNDLCDPDVVGGALAIAQGIGDHLVLEVTETAVLRDPAAALAGAQRLRACGISLSLDDFGTGNSSLTYLRQLSPDEVKVDRSFTMGVAASAADRSIVESTVRLAHSVGATVTAEGVEDAQTLAWLARAGCDHAQGYYIAAPMDRAAFEALLQGFQLPEPLPVA
jgi:EAL domain-containing protein (putative c-di-GMP-specific phosphodiesterase class I)/ABC-type amino acid transport substrate-binding protein/GGDEF domain-containing protein